MLYDPIEKLITKKGTGIYSIPPDATVYSALEMMEEKNVGSLVVKDNGRILGLFTERDNARKVILKGRTPKEMTVREAMIRTLYSVNKNQTIEDCMTLMTMKKLRYILVMEGNDLLGIVSIGDVVNEMILEHRNTIENLENYIIGG